MELPEVELENQNKSQQKDYKWCRRPELLGAQTLKIYLVPALKLKLRIQVKLINIVLLVSKFSNHCILIDFLKIYKK